MKVLVCGGRDFTDQAYAFHTLSSFHQQYHFTSLIHGGSRGADQFAHKWAIANQVPMYVYFADWEKHGKAAGPVRNRQMLEHGKPDLVIAFPGGRGTANMMQLAHAAGVKVIETEEIEL